MTSQQRIDTYLELAKIKPAWAKSKFPFDSWTPEKVTFTERQIELYWKNNPEFLQETEVKGGGNIHIVVID